MYTLIIEDHNGHSAAEISFDQGSYTIGRVDGNDVVLASNSVSRSHARIFVSNNKCYIDDLGSANGVLIDGVQIKERTEIRHGSKIRIGEYTLYLEYKDQADLNSGQDILKTQIVSGEQSGYKIVRVGDKFGGEEFTLSEASNSIGRTEDNYIMLSDSSISRNHAKIVNTGMVFKVIDLNSSNGTFVNNKKLPSGGESVLRNGDLVRFGNLSFVFVPTSQNVDPRQYVQNRTDTRRLFVIVFGIIIMLLIVVVIISFYLLHAGAPADNATQDNAKELSAARFETQIDDAEKYYKDARFQLAQDLIEPLLKSHPDNERISTLSKKIQFELDNEKYINEASALIDNRKFEDAIEKLHHVDSDSMLYDKAQEQIKESKHRINVMNYNDARSKCDDDVNTECIEDLCEAAQKLGESDANKLEDAKSYMLRLSKTKMKYAAAAKKCYNELTSHDD